MTIMRGDEDVTEEIMNLAETLRKGEHGRKQRASVYLALTRVLVLIEQIPPPWLDDCVDKVRTEVIRLRGEISDYDSPPLQVD